MDQVCDGEDLLMLGEVIQDETQVTGNDVDLFGQMQGGEGVDLLAGDDAQEQQEVDIFAAQGKMPGDLDAHTEPEVESDLLAILGENHNDMSMIENANTSQDLRDILGEEDTSINDALNTTEDILAILGNEEATDDQMQEQQQQQDDEIVPPSLDCDLMMDEETAISPAPDPEMTFPHPVELPKVDQAKPTKKRQRKQQRPIDFFFTVGKKRVGLRLRNNGDFADTIACLDQAMEKEHIPAYIMDEIRKKLTIHLLRNGVEYEKPSRSDLENHKLRWQRFLEDKQKKNTQRNLSQVPVWFASDQQSNQVQVYRQAMRLAIEDDEMFGSICAHEQRISEILRSLNKEFREEREKLQDVQLNEMQFMSESLSEEGSAITADDVEKLSMAHVEAMEQLTRKHRDSMQSFFEEKIKEHRRMVLSLVGNSTRPATLPRNGSSYDSGDGSDFDLTVIQAQKDRQAKIGKVLKHNNPKAQKDLTQRGLGALICNEEEDNKQPSSQTGQFVSAVMTNLTVGKWIGDVLKHDHLAGLGLEDEAQRKEVEKRLSKYSTALEILEVFLGAQLKVLFHLRIETMVGGILYAQQKHFLFNKAFLKPDSSTFLEWRRTGLRKLYDEPHGDLETNGFTVVAAPFESSSPSRLNERFVDGSRVLCEMHFEQNNNKAGQVLETWHSVLDMGIICTLHGQSPKQDDSIRAIIEHACHIGARQLIIPLREWVLESSALYVEARALEQGSFERSKLNPKAVAKLFRSVKAALTNVAHKNMAKKLTSITFLLKSTCSSMDDGELVARAKEWAKSDLNGKQLEIVRNISQNDAISAGKAKSLLEKIFTT